MNHLISLLVIGQLAVAFAETTGIAGISGPQYERGVQYLLRTQQADGSWYVKTRALAFQPYFESGFPYGYDQWISAAATSWATMALAAALPPAQSAQVRRK
jgi:hypothetical protein